MNRYERLEAARVARNGFDPFAAVIPDLPVEPPRQYTGMRRTDFAVGKLYDDGRFVPVKPNLTREIAESVAGRYRDAATDEEVARMLEEKWSWSHQAMNGSSKIRWNFKPKARSPEERKTLAKKASGERWKRQGFAGMTPERRAEISAKANAARAAKLTPERRSEIARNAHAARFAR